MPFLTLVILSQEASRINAVCFVSSLLISYTFQVLKYLATDGENDKPWILIQAVLSSVARTAIIPMQDILCLGSSARMNTPATEVLHNWIVLFIKKMLLTRLAKTFFESKASSFLAAPVSHFLIFAFWGNNKAYPTFPLLIGLCALWFQNLHLRPFWF